MILGPRDDQDHLMDVARSIQAADAERGERVEGWSFQGYRGVRSPRIRWGLQGANLLWETSSEAARDIWRPLVRCGGRATRLDVQTTVAFSEPQPSFGERCMTPSRTAPPSRLPRPKIHGVTSASDGAWCGTVGRRTSERYWRVYDKGAESGKAPAGTRWRLELEAKGNYAEGVRQVLCEAPSVPELCYKLAVSSWEQAGFSWPLPGRRRAAPNVVRPRDEQPSITKTAMWLSLSVKPVVTRLLPSMSVEDLLELLGLEQVAMPRPSDEPRR